MLVTYKQCIAARDLLGWTREELEKKSKISRSTLAEFERGNRNLRMDNFEKLLNTFEEAGIKFVNNEKGVGVIELSKK
jgi:transcriptional regulator with XRE-family HTH domain